MAQRLGQALVIPVPVGAILVALALLAAPQPAVRSVVTSQVLPPPATIHVAENAACGEWWELAAEVGWPEGELPTMDRVMWCESKCQPHAYNRSGASGLMQVLKSWAPADDLFDPTTNLATALRVWQRQGWRAWSCW